MAKVHNNIFVRGLTGAVGDQFVIRKARSGRTIIANKPMFDDDREYTDAQKTQQQKFRKATTYARTAQHQPLYQEKVVGTSLSAYNLAVADYFIKPLILDIDISRWTGAAGQPIVIRAQDNVLVASVRLVIRENGETYDAIDGGEAERSELDGLSWIFTTTVPITKTPGMQLDAYAYDLPGNLTIDSLVLP